jgi:CheY-like chemotaxis protein
MKKWQILVVDDEQSNLVLLEKILESLGCKVKLARNAQEALAKVNDEIDLALVDVIMPEIDGYELTRQGWLRMGCVR